MGRNTQGVRVINLKDGDSIADVTRVVIEEKEVDEDASEDDAPSTNGELSGDDAADAVREAE
jgi:DNA gyrase subunit A